MPQEVCKYKVLDECVLLHLCCLAMMIILSCRGRSSSWGDQTILLSLAHICTHTHTHTHTLTHTHTHTHTYAGMGHQHV